MTRDAEVRGRFDQRHLIELLRRGLLDRVPVELGPMPLVDMGEEPWKDLCSRGVVDPATGQLEPTAQEMFAAITAYDWAISGLLLLYNERQPVVVDLPEEFFTYGVQYAIRDVPRVGFLIGVKDSQITTVVMANGEMDIYSDTTAADRGPALFMQVSKILLSALDPNRQWEPYPMARVSTLAPQAGGVTAAKRNADPKTRTKEITQTVSALEAGGTSPSAAKAIGELLSQDNVATAQITLSRRAATDIQTAHNNAAGIMFFLGPKTGTVVSYPTRSPDGRPWINYEPATPHGVATAIEALHDGLDAAKPADIVSR